MSIRSAFFARCLALIAGLTSANVANAQSCCATIPVSVDCVGDSQDCGVRWYFSTNSPTNRLEFALTASPTHCSDVGFRIFMDGALIATTSPLEPGQQVRFFSDAPAGPHSFEVEAYGIEGGCNNGTLAGWGGTLELCGEHVTTLWDLVPRTLCFLPEYFLAFAESPWPLTYRWYLNGLQLADGPIANGATTNFLQLLPGAALPGDFTLEYDVTTPCGQVFRSNPITMTLAEADPPIITLSPEPQTACVGGEATFRCESTNNSLQVWYRNPPSPIIILDSPGFIEGANTDTLRFTNLSEFDDGLEVFSVIFNDCGTTTVSTAARLTVLPEGSCDAPCPADFNQDGGVDGADIDSFFGAWEAGDAGADVNQDGGVDGSDIDTFFTAWEAGGC